MKRKILSVLSVLMAVLMSTAALAACNKAPAGADSSGGSSESESTEQGGESSEQTSTTEENNVPFLTFEKEKEFWSAYSEKYTLYSCDWANDRYFAIVLKSKSDGSYKIVFWDTENSAVIEAKYLDEKSAFAALDTNASFSRDNAFYLCSDSGQFFRISFDTFECSPAYNALFSEEGFISRKGTVAELVDKNSIRLYDVLAPNEQLLIKTDDIIQLNQGISWSFNGEYFAVMNHGEGETLEDNEYSVFDKNGAFVRYVYGSDIFWDYNSAWLTHSYPSDSEEADVWSVYSLDEPEKAPYNIEDVFSMRNCISPRNGIYYADVPSEDRAFRTVTMVDTSSGAVKPCFEYGIGELGFIKRSPNGNFLAAYRCEYPQDYLLFAFIKLGDYST